MNSQQFESNNNKLRATIQAYLNTNKTWIVNDFRETDPMDVDHIGKSKGRGKSKSKSRQEQREQPKWQQRQGQEQRKEQGPQPRQAKARTLAKAKAKAVENMTMTKSATCAERRVIPHEIVGHEPIMTRKVENVNAEPGKEYVYAIEHEINDVNLSQDGCVEREDGLVMIDSGVSVNKVQTENGCRNMERDRFGQKFAVRRNDMIFHVVNVTKPILSVSCLCEQGVETHLAKKSFMRFGAGHEPLIRKGGVYFAKTQTVNACARADGCTEKLVSTI